MKTVRRIAHGEGLLVLPPFLVVALFALAFAIASTPVAADPPTDAGCPDCVIPEESETAAERVMVVERDGEVLASIEPLIDSKEDLLAYRENATERLAPGLPASTRFAAVTFSAKLTLEETEALLADVEILQLRYVSHPYGGGQIAYPPLPEHTERLERSIQSGEGRPEESQVPEDFRLIDGYVAAEIYGTPGNLRALQSHDKAFLVDVGPAESLLQYPGAQAVLSDIYYSYSKYMD